MSSIEYTKALTRLVLENLEFQHDWTQLQMHSHPDLPRDVIFGLPNKRLYIHPDEQVEIIKAEKDKDEPMVQEPEFEWVLPLHLAEKWTLEGFAALFDALDALPPGAALAEQNKGEQAQEQWKQWRTTKRAKRVLLAVVQDDSTIVYYFIHNDITKPRQN